ncbi:hybrid sensor histidine kinase/response regulator [Noviherbaspirillum sp. ST9]|uniref:hybrid sensor histidine kinase/response regulator n=1 Tax=Noviherbaspirillum sp. ST9 TaxID=3401606 RepID=UPI003B58A3F9
MQAESQKPQEVIEILVVEDSPTQAAKLRILLEGKGYRVQVAGNGMLALQSMHTRRPDLVLSDIIMPEMDGYALCQAIKSDPAIRSVPVILVTSLIDPGDIVRGLECGADNFVRKPYADEYLLVRIEHVLRNFRLRQDGESGGTAIYLNGEKHIVNADRQQILDLLVSTYEQAVLVNEELQARERQVNELNVRLGHHAAQLEATNREIARKNVELEQANRMKSEFLANMSHELRTPLNAIIGFSEALRDGLLGALAPAQQDAAGDIYDSGKHLLLLINDILDLSKIEAGKMELELEPTDMQDLMQNTLTVFKDKAIAGQIRLRLEMETVDTMLVDRRKTRQIVYNLLSNAVKFTQPGGSVTLRMCSQDAGALQSHRLVGEEGPDPSVRQFLTICIIDTGIGISEADVGRLFQPFVQLDSGLARKYEGTGLGLALVKQLVELHGGVMTVRSELQQGSEFMVWLPYREATLPAPAAA